MDPSRSSAPGHPQPCVPSQANKTPLRALDPIRLSGMNCSPDFTPSFANLGRPVMGNRGLVSTRPAPPSSPAACR